MNTTEGVWTMSAHTPGPWAVAVEDDKSVVVYEAVTLANTDICVMSWNNNDAANARLIAAAPELLEALKAGLSQLGASQYKAAVAAIAKAEWK
jgi:hypothetical protein